MSNRTNPKTASNTLGSLCVFLSACTFALGGILIKVNSWSSVTINGMRCFFAFLIIASYMILTRHRFVFNRGVLACALANYLMGLLFVMANKLTTAANAIVLQFTMPIFIILFLWIFWKKKPKKAELLACAISFAGVLCFFFDKLSLTGMQGNLLAILSGMFYAVVFLTKKIPGADFESAIALSFVISFAAALPSILPELSGGINMVNLASTMALGFVQMGVSYILLNLGLNRVSAFAASLLSMIEPILNPILVAIFFHEMIGPFSFVGALVVLGCAIYYNLSSINK